MEKKINEALNRLNKTRKERTPNLRQEREQRDREERELQKQLLREKVMKEYHNQYSSLTTTVNIGMTVLLQ